MPAVRMLIRVRGELECLANGPDLIHPSRLDFSLDKLATALDQILAPAESRPQAIRRHWRRFWQGLAGTFGGAAATFIIL